MFFVLLVNNSLPRVLSVLVINNKERVEIDGKGQNVGEEVRGKANGKIKGRGKANGKN